MANSDTPLTQYTPDDFLDQPIGQKSNGLVGLRVRRSILIAFILSLLLHSVLMLKVIQFDQQEEGSPFEASDTIVVTLAPPPTAEKPKQAEPQKVQKKQPKKKKILKSKQKVKKKTVKKPKVVIRKLTPEPIKPPEITPLPKLVEPIEAAPTDMAEYVKQQQANRQAQESAAAKENAIAVAKLKGPSKEELRNQRIKENLKSGTNGIFEIIRNDALGGSFKFKGWTNDYSAANLQYFDVQAQPGKDTRLLMIKRMIKLIRTHYTEDFTWDSHRIGGSVTLSARLEDNEGLEHFLMQEFFGEHYNR